MAEETSLLLSIFFDADVTPGAGTAILRPLGDKNPTC